MHTLRSSPKARPQKRAQRAPRAVQRAPRRAMTVRRPAVRVPMTAQRRLFSVDATNPIVQFVQKATGDATFAPDQTAFTVNHEWFKVTGANEIQVGITKYASDSLDSLLFVEIESAATDGDVIAAGEPVAAIDSTKGFAQVYAPIPLTLKQPLTLNADELSANPNELAIFEATPTADFDQADVKLLTRPQYTAYLQEKYNVDPAEYGF